MHAAVAYLPMRVKVAIDERHRHSASLKAAPPASRMFYCVLRILALAGLASGFLVLVQQVYKLESAFGSA